MSMDKWLNHADPTIKELAEKADRYQRLRANNELTTAEYESLCKQLLTLKGIDLTVKVAEERQQIQEFLGVLRVILGIVL